jgi:predicted phage tail protein
VEDLSFSTLAAGLIFGIIGGAGFKIGKNIGSIHKMIVGAILMVYPYFTPGAVITFSAGVLLTIVLFAKD